MKIDRLSFSIFRVSIDGVNAHELSIREIDDIVDELKEISDDYWRETTANVMEIWRKQDGGTQDE